jgi:hypothetical protein
MVLEDPGQRFLGSLIPNKALHGDIPTANQNKVLLKVE